MISLTKENLEFLRKLSRYLTERYNQELTPNDVVNILISFFRVLAEYIVFDDILYSSTAVPKEYRLLMNIILDIIYFSSSRTLKSKYK